LFARNGIDKRFSVGLYVSHLSMPAPKILEIVLTYNLVGNSDRRHCNNCDRSISFRKHFSNSFVVFFHLHEQYFDKGLIYIEDSPVITIATKCVDLRLKCSKTKLVNINSSLLY
jgi:hypothetical protein